MPGLEASRGGLNERLASTGLASTVGSGGGPGSVTGPGVGGSSLVSDHLSELQRIITSHKVCKNFFLQHFAPHTTIQIGFQSDI